MQVDNDPDGDVLVIVSEGRRYEAAVLPSRAVASMRQRLRSQSKECVMDTLGISANTWLKIKKGEPIRQSTAEQLMRRIRLTTH